MSKKIIIIGAGYGGLAAAASLGHKGCTVTLLEKNSLEESRTGLLEENGYHFDTGASWYLMPEIFDQFFHSINRNREEYYQITRLNPAFRIFWEDDNSVYDIPDSLEETINLFESVEKGAGDHLRQYIQKAKYKYDIGVSKYIQRPFLSASEVLEWELIKNIRKFELLTPMSQTVNKRFKSPLLQSILTHSTVFLGGSPANTPGLYNLISWSEVGDGVYYPYEGFWKVTQSFEKVALEESVNIRYNESVIELVTSNNKISKVITSKSEYEADVIVANADYHFVETQLLKEEHTTYDNQYWKTRTLSPATLLIYLGLDVILDKMEHHTFVFNSTHIHQADDLFSSNQWPENPQFYISARSKTDPHVAPKGGEALMILLPIASGIEDSPALRDKYTNYIIDKLSGISGFDIRPHIRVNQTKCIQDFEDMYNSYKGNAFGLAHTLKQSLIFRPKMKSKKVDNLFYTGQYTNPGVGTPLAILSGSIVARLIEEKYGNK